MNSYLNSCYELTYHAWIHMLHHDLMTIWIQTWTHMYMKNIVNSYMKWGGTKVPVEMSQKPMSSYTERTWHGEQAWKLKHIWVYQRKEWELKGQGREGSKDIFMGHYTGTRGSGGHRQKGLNKSESHRTWFNIVVKSYITLSLYVMCLDHSLYILYIGLNRQLGALSLPCSSSHDFGRKSGVQLLLLDLFNA